MHEVEAKFRVPDLEPIRARLRKVKAKSSPAAVQEDVFFAHPCRDLALADEVLRLRRESGRFELTYKGARNLPPTKGLGSNGRSRRSTGTVAGEGEVKSRRESNLRLDQDPTPLLGELGFAPRFRLVKHRESWKVGEVVVALDWLEGLGTFVEVEVQSDDVEAARREVEAYAKRLGLERAPRVRESYLELAVAAGTAVRV